MSEILLIEDEEDYQILVRCILKRAGLTVHVAGTGAQGLAALEIIHPDLLILDINLPDTDGYTICQQLRRDRRWIDLPVLMLTVRRRPEEWLQGFGSGTTDYLSKPLNPPELLERVQSCLEANPRTLGCTDTAEYQLIQSAVSGNRTAFQVLIQKYRSRLMESLSPLVKNDDLMEDVLAFAFATAFEKLREFRGQSTFFTWLYRIAANQSTKKYRRPPSISLDSMEATETELLSSERLEEKPEHALAESDAAERARKALSLVPGHYRKILQMFFMEDRSYAHIARALRIPRGTVMSRLHKGRQLLQEASQSVL